MKEIEKKKDDRNVVPFAKDGYKVYAYRTVSLIEQLRKVETMKKGDGRHRMLFAYYTLSRFVYPKSVAAEKAKCLNNRFLEKLRNDDLKSQLMRVDKHIEDSAYLHGNATYAFSDTTLVTKFLGLTQEEALEAGFLKTAVRKMQYKEHQSQALQRDKRIAFLWLQKKCTIKKISQVLKEEGYLYYSERTIKNRLKSMNLTCARTQKIEDIVFEKRYAHKKGNVCDKIVVNEKETEEIYLKFEQSVVSKILGNQNLWITGEAGAGKTVLINQYIKYLQAMRIPYIATAPYAIAAKKINGKTLHTAMTIDPHIVWTDDMYPGEKDIWMLRNVKVIIIDEIGTIRPDIFDRVIKLTQLAERVYHHPIRLVVSGDITQLGAFYTPEEREYAQLHAITIDTSIWEKEAWKNTIKDVIYLQKCKRIQNEEYLHHLNEIRIGEHTYANVMEINKNVSHNSEAIEKLEDLNAVYLAARKEEVDVVNRAYVKRHRKEKTYTILKGIVSKEGVDGVYPVKQKIEVFVGMPVMTIKNSRDYVNGTVGIVKEIGDNHIIITSNGEDISVERKEFYDMQGKGDTMLQYPIVPAYAMTIHKAQGTTLASAVLNPSTFSPGQAYVALSRVRNPEKLILSRKLNMRDIIVDRKAVKYEQNIRKQVM